MEWIKAVILILFSMVLLVLVSLAGFWWYEIRGRDHVSDEILINNLKADSAKYEQLIVMFREDSPIAVVHPNFVSPEKIISDVRWEEYKKLFIELELDGGMRSSDVDSIWFISTSQGLSTGGSFKGYMFEPEQPKPLYENLNQIPGNFKSNINGYRKIDDQWYIVFRRHD